MLFIRSSTKLLKVLIRQVLRLKRQVQRGLTFSHVSVSRDGASLAGDLAGTAGGQAGQADTLLQVCLSVQFEQGDVVVQGLGVVVVVDIRGGHPQGLGAGAAELLGEVVVTDTHVDSVTGADDAEKIIAKIRQNIPLLCHSAPLLRREKFLLLKLPYHRHYTRRSSLLGGHHQKHISRMSQV